VAPLEVGSMPLFSLDGRTAMREETISEVTKMISSEMVKAGEAREPFQLRDIRRTVETMLAGLRTTKDVRGQLQSHGLNGVQQRHYDMHEYLEEKRAALQILGVHTGRLQPDCGEDSASTAHKNDQSTNSSAGGLFLR